MSFKSTILVAVTATYVAAAPAWADPQHGHSVVPPAHVSGPKSTAPAAPTPKASAVTPTASTTSATVTMNPIAAKISTLPQLNAKVTALLPPKTSLNTASAGFKNQGQFIAALHVSRNLRIPFADLKRDMTTKHMSLGQSIHALRKTADAPHEAEKGETEATRDLKTPKVHSGR